ncbi:Disease resistance protein (CC-NBS-LRR class) family [Rhynchospora pubera]|uniref:Disease resistance protein (CC-NBS-LRR class) family n=1 Tax=Rhynchospora pubera TaxID=906938 RepID=A0AAV8ERA3_9POAL|nr:Disease resistance protein (CC-NBS-LRR class) family [Rhynchospora pubera]
MHWVEEIRDVAERIEDAIDIYTGEVKANNLVKENNLLNRQTRVADWLNCLFPCIKNCMDVMPANPLNIISVHNLSVELDDIEATMKRIKEKRDILGTPALGESSRNEKLPERPPTFPYIDETKVIVGQDDDKRVILEELLSPEPAHLSVVSIVGTGGLGKTTLARSIFNSPKIKENFNTRIWLSVSQQYNMINLLKTMLRQTRDLTGTEENMLDEGYFIGKIRSHLEQTRYFVVLDDVWSVEFWPNYFQNTCPGGLKGSRVVITTRDLNVANVCTRSPHKLQFLSEEESKLLLFKVAFPYQDPPSGLDKIATKLVRYCGGLPLALEVVGGLLSKKDTYESWRKVAENLDWHSSKGHKCMKILETSYDYMPIVLKKCFMYFASFPEDYQIDAESLIWKWVAERLVPDEITGKECLEELFQRSMILVSARSYDDSIEKCGVHDLLRELAIEKAKDNKFLVVFSNNNVDANFSDARRVSFQSCNLTENNNYGSSSKKLRSLFIFGESLSDYSGFRMLKVLQLNNCDLGSQANKWFKELIQLRNLEFNNCEIADKEIPEEICHMQNLQTLNCEHSVGVKLPESMWSIKTLRHVSTSRTETLPLPSAELSFANLQTLRDVRLKHTEGELYSFPSLCELSLNQSTSRLIFAISLLANMNQSTSYSWDPFTSLLRNKTLRKLVDLTVYGDNIPLDVVDMRRFVFFEHLQCLNLLGAWCDDVCLSAHFFPSCLSKLVLSSCHFTEDPMPELGKLLNLKILDLLYATYMGRQMTCLAGGFPQLRELNIPLQPNVEDLNIEEGTLSTLKKLEISLQLRRIPDLQHLTKLEEFIWNAPFSQEYIQMMRQKNQHKLNHIRAVIINRRGRL